MYIHIHICIYIYIIYKHCSCYFWFIVFKKESITIQAKDVFRFSFRTEVKSSSEMWHGRMAHSYLLTVPKHGQVSVCSR
jgi:hypothetical protein